MEKKPINSRGIKKILKRRKMKDIYIDYSKQLRRGGNRRNKKDLDAEIKLLEKEGWTVKFGKYDGINEGGFRYWFEATKYEEIKEGECPKCKSENNVKILYGSPSPSALKEAARGKIELGGCEVTENDPTRLCRDCGNKFQKRGKND